MAKRYGGEWNEHADVLAVYPLAPSDADIVYACYDVEGYEGSALVVWEIEDAWFENHDSHCSCNGLENWNPELTSALALLMRDDAALRKAVGARVVAMEKRAPRKLMAVNVPPRGRRAISLAKF